MTTYPSFVIKIMVIISKSTCLMGRKAPTTIEGEETEVIPAETTEEAEERRDGPSTPGTQRAVMREEEAGEEETTQENTEDGETILGMARDGEKRRRGERRERLGMEEMTMIGREEVLEIERRREMIEEEVLEREETVEGLMRELRRSLGEIEDRRREGLIREMRIGHIERREIEGQEIGT